MIRELGLTAYGALVWKPLLRDFFLAARIPAAREQRELSQRRHIVG